MRVTFLLKDERDYFASEALVPSPDAEGGPAGAGGVTRLTFLLEAERDYLAAEALMPSLESDCFDIRTFRYGPASAAGVVAVVAGLLGEADHLVDDLGGSKDRGWLLIAARAAAAGRTREDSVLQLARRIVGQLNQTWFPLGWRNLWTEAGMRELALAHGRDLIRQIRDELFQAQGRQ